jgi:hypothetical protein
VPLTLAAQYPMRDRATAEAVAVALRERFRARRERGDWFRAAWGAQTQSCAEIRPICREDE